VARRDRVLHYVVQPPRRESDLTPLSKQKWASLRAQTRLFCLTRARRRSDPSCRPTGTGGSSGACCWRPRRWPSRRSWPFHVSGRRSDGMIIRNLLEFARLWPLAAALLAGSLLAMVLVYPRQTRHLPPVLRVILPFLRLLVVAAMAMSALRPAVSRTRSVEERGAIVVILDRSMSMGVADRALPADPAARVGVLSELISIGQSVGSLPRGVRPAAVDAIGADVARLDGLAEEIGRAQRELDFARLLGRSMAEAQNRLDRAIADFIPCRAGGRGGPAAGAAGGRCAGDAVQSVRRPGGVDSPLGPEHAAGRISSSWGCRRTPTSVCTKTIRLRRTSAMISRRCRGCGWRGRFWSGLGDCCRGWTGGRPCTHSPLEMK